MNSCIKKIKKYYCDELTIHDLLILKNQHSKEINATFSQTVLQSPTYKILRKILNLETNSKALHSSKS